MGVPMAALFADATNVLKRLYADGVPLNLATRERYLLKTMTKKDDFGGDSEMAVPIQVANPQGPGPSPTYAYSTTSGMGTMANAYKRFLITRYKAFHGAKLDREAIMAARAKGKGAFVDFLQEATDSMLDELGALASRWLYGDGTAAIGTRTGALSGETFTLATAGDAKNFFVGQQLVCYNGTGPTFRTIAAASGDGGTFVTVASVNEEAGTVTLTTGDSAAIASYASGDTFAPQGVTTSDQAYPGLAGWLPLVTPSATTFYGVNRSLDPTRLAGVRLDNATGSIADNIMTVAERCHVIFPGRKRVCVVNNVNFTTLSKDADGKHIYNDGNGTAQMGFDTIKVMTSAGAVQVYADPDCPANRGYILDLQTWQISHMGGFPQLVDDGGGQLMQPISGTNSVLIKGCFYATPRCNAPGSNGVFSI